MPDWANRPPEATVAADAENSLTERPPSFDGSPSRRFAVLEHRWNGVHWDFLVQEGPALRTWAFDAPIVAGRELAARELPPHRLVYLDYEGPISGGRGTVRRWDGGEAWVALWDEGRVRLRLAGGQLVGSLEGRAVDDLAVGPRRWLFRLGKLS